MGAASVVSGVWWLETPMCRTCDRGLQEVQGSCVLVARISLIICKYSEEKLILNTNFSYTIQQIKNTLPWGPKCAPLHAQVKVKFPVNFRAPTFLHSQYSRIFPGIYTKIQV